MFERVVGIGNERRLALLSLRRHMKFKAGDFVGILENDGKIGCPIRKVAEATEKGFKVETPVGNSRLIRYTEGWEKVAGKELSAPLEDCYCYRCSSPLFELAFCAE